MKRLSAATALVLTTSLLAACGEQPQQAENVPRGGEPAATRDGPLPRGKGFDFYVLSLSWSPTWCADNDAQGRTAQCRAGNRHGFIVHGLWPQYERGYPEFCPSRQPDRVPESLGRQMFDIMPSMGLIGHQWRKHGSCSGLSQTDYFAVTRAAREAVVIPAALSSAGGTRSPAQIEDAMIAANPGLSEKGIAVTCDAPSAQARLEELRICLTADLTFRDCIEVDRAACRAAGVVQPPIR